MSDDLVAEIVRRLARIEKQLIKDWELDELGHRIIFDRQTGWSSNVAGVHCDPALLDEHGYQVRFPD